MSEARLPVRHTVDPAGAGIAALLRRVRLTAAAGVPPAPGAFRVAGVPLVAAVVVTAAPGWATYTTRTGDTLSEIALRHGTDARTLARLNGLADPDQLPTGVRITVPAGGSVARQRAAAAGLHPVDAHGTPAITYRVREGDTLSEIALRTGTSLRAVLAANGLRPTSIIRPGQLLKLPALPTPAGAERSARARTTTRPVVHVVRPGDTVWGVAQRFKVPVDAVLRANRLGADARILPGRKLVLPGAAARTRTRISPPTVAHVVRRGETVSAIARRYGVGVTAVLAANHLDRAAVIHPGRRLLVPGAERRGSVISRQGRPSRPPSNVPQRSYPEAVTRAAAANRAALGRRDVPSREETRRLVAATARRYGVDPALALAIATIESGFDQRQVSIANAIGTMQVIPSSGDWASQLVGRRLDLMDAEDNVEAGVAILAALLRAADQQTAIAGYYQGLAGVRRNGMYADTRRYVATVRALMARY